jgi:membrane protein implicated in regulation of membrane protease activity
MSEHSVLGLTGSERLQRRITLADYLTGAAVALWLAPIACVIAEVCHHILILVSALASTLAMAAFMVSVALRAYRTNRQWRERAALTALRRHNELVAQLAANHKVVADLVDRNHAMLSSGLGEIHRQVNSVTGMLHRASWDIYADAITDVAGGPEVVNSTDTRHLPPHPGASNVVRFPHTFNGNSGF